jgi:hypothetical protein
MAKANSQHGDMDSQPADFNGQTSLLKRLPSKFTEAQALRQAEWRIAWALVPETNQRPMVAVPAENRLVLDVFEAVPTLHESGLPSGTAPGWNFLTSCL